MATLILSTVGQAIGGPIGSAIGATVGGVIDRELFGPGPREGYRLSDLRLQTSSYGTAIPRLYGRNRVAGTVIWATDLKESSSTSGGKGQPKTTTYSYSASFAVALSSRPIAGIGRIWADGKLLRGAAGDLKVATTLRVANGAADQPVDPLIASAVGAGQCPAYRGIACAIFEDLALADYGNRIPSLTFEVIADEAGVTVGSIAGDILPAPFGAESAVAMTGYAASGANIGEAVSALATLGALVRGGMAAGPVLRAPDGGTAAVIVPNAAVAVEREAARSHPRATSIRFFDPARDYQTGSQMAGTAGAAGDIRRIDMPATLDSAGAMVAARRIMRGALARGETVSVKAGMAAAGLRPGDNATIDGMDGIFTVRTIEIDAGGVAVRLSPKAVYDGIDSSPTVMPGAPVFETDLPIPPTVWHFVDLPRRNASDAPSIHIIAAGTGPGWQGADMTIEGPDGNAVPFARIRQEGVIGTVTAAVDMGSTTLFDRVNRIDVALTHDGMALEGADDSALLGGANLAMVGREIIQFGRAVQTGTLTWRIDQLLRGRGATEHHGPGHVAGESFILLDSAAMIALPQDIVPGASRVAIAGLADLYAASDIPEPETARRPFSPVHAMAMADGNGGFAVSWIRRSVAGQGWPDGIDIPIGEDRELYRVAITGPGGESVLAETTAPSCTVSASDISPYLPGPVTVHIRQVGSHAISVPLAITLNL